MILPPKRFINRKGDRLVLDNKWHILQPLEVSLCSFQVNKYSPLMRSPDEKEMGEKQYYSTLKPRFLRRKI